MSAHFRFRLAEVLHVYFVVPIAIAISIAISIALHMQKDGYFAIFPFSGGICLYICMTFVQSIFRLFSLGFFASSSSSFT